MSSEVKRFLERLKTVSQKHIEEKVSVQAIYKRIRKGIYKTINICGTTYIIEENGEDKSN